MRTYLPRVLTLALAAPVASLISAAAMAAPPPPAFAVCGACHAVTPGAKKIGPSLFGVVGRKAGTVPGFTYSNALKAFGKSWTPAELDAYIASPMKDIPGTKMPYGGMANPDQRKAVVAYLATLK